MPSMRLMGKSTCMRVISDERGVRGREEGENEGKGEKGKKKGAYLAWFKARVSAEPFCNLLAHFSVLVDVAKESLAY